MGNDHEKKKRAAVTTEKSLPPWHTQSVEECATLLKTPLQSGLADSEVKTRHQNYGPNRLSETQRKSPLSIFLNQFKDFMILLLMGASIISGFIGEIEDTLAILAIVGLNALLGFFQEYRAEKAMETLQRMTQTNAKVIRSGHPEIINSEYLVPGDVVLLEAGDIVPADLRVVVAEQLRAEESPLTGESLPVDKVTDLLSDSDLSLGERKNMLYKATSITYGRGRGVVVATGMQTEIGRIARLLSGSEGHQTPLQKRLHDFGKKIAIVAMIICAMIFSLGIFRGESPLLMFMTALSLAVAAIPEALPAIVTVLLALGARRLIQRNALIRKLPAVETLGSVTFICSDKTGTLTQNRMRVEEFQIGSQQSLSTLAAEKEITPSRSPLFFQALALNNDAHRDKNDLLLGDPTEKALYEFASKNKFTKEWIEKESPRVAEVPFSSDRSMMSTLHRLGSKRLLFTKGAPEKVLARCQFLTEGHQPLTASERLALQGDSHRLAQKGLRVLAVAYKELTHGLNLSESDEDDLIFLGFVGLIDPPREEALQAVAEAHKASIKVVMITGDHPLTAAAIAQNLGIISPTEGAGVVTGAEVKSWSQEDLACRVGEVRVYARMSPEQKIRIVETLQRRGEFVAMTGDGINDAPALRKADIGVSMGKLGTDVAREASHMVLLDDNFATIVCAVREGRRIFDNIRKFVRYALATNAGEVWTLFLAPLLGLPLPFLPIHLLWINLVTDGLPGLALAAEPEEPNIMDRPPRPPRESIFAQGLWQHVAWVGLFMAMVNLSVMTWYLRKGTEHWQSIVFTLTTFTQMGHLLAVRSERNSLFRQGLFSNPYLLGAVLLTLLLQLSTLYIPAFNRIFKTHALSIEELGVCFLMAPALFCAVELEKWLVRRGLIYTRS